MPIHDKAFWFIGFFLVGVFTASSLPYSFSVNLVIVVGGAIIATAVSFFGKQTGLAWLALGLVAGSLFYGVYRFLEDHKNIPYGIAETTGIVLNIRGEISKNIIVKLEKPHEGIISIYKNQAPQLRYGDEISIQGTITAPPKENAGYLRARGVNAVSENPALKIKSHNKGNSLKAALLKFKDFSKNSLIKVLPPAEAAFLTGITLGDTGTLDPSFKEKLNATGTRHIVALSGYNITIVSHMVLFLILGRIRRRNMLLCVVAVISAFVAMTGAESSVVRAAIMSFLVLYGSYAGRIYSPRNAIMIAAFLMTLIHPDILAYDVGFQLSFLALAGIIYLREPLLKIFHLKNESSILAWRENFLSTTSAQLAVAPILLNAFKSTSVISILVNILLLPAIPITMMIGFSIVGFSLISTSIAALISPLARLFVSYELGIINYFSKWGLSVGVNSVSPLTIFIYYVILGVMVLYFKNLTSPWKKNVN